MCGIAGIYQLKTQATPEPQVLAKMNDSQWHRGPDAGDYFFQPTVGLAHRRLSIIDIAGSPQPMQSANAQACIVFNGEIYNYRELRQELLGKGYQFNTNGDTETILNAWLEWGEDCVHHLRGMFAFAIWDNSRQCLFLARDRLGIKPLFYSLLDDGQFIFGSELKVLRNHPDFITTLRDSTIEDYFSFGYIPEPYTIYQHSYKLAPGHTLLLQHGQTQLSEPKQYWDVNFSLDNAMSLADASAELAGRLEAKTPRRDWRTALPFALVIGGALGNVIDRQIHGHVVDFIQWHWRDHYWPAFNIADCAVVGGAIGIALFGLFEGKKKAG